MRVHIGLAIAALLTLSGCKKGDTGSGSPAPAAEDKKARASTDKEVSRHAAAAPCELLSEALLRETLGIPKQTAIANDSARKTYCSYKWDKPNADEVRAKIKKLQAERVKAMMRRARQGKLGQGIVDNAMRMPSVENRVHLSLAGRPFKDAAAARSAYEATVQRLTQGIKARARGVKVNFQSKMEPVDGVADGAAWSPKMNQLTVLAGNRLFHLGAQVDVESDTNLAVAKKLATAVARR